ASPVGRWITGQCQMDAGHLVTRVHRTSRSRRGVHSPRHRREYPKTTHGFRLPRDQVQDGPMADALFGEPRLAAIYDLVEGERRPRGPDRRGLGCDAARRPRRAPPGRPPGVRGPGPGAPGMAPMDP